MNCSVCNSKVCKLDKRISGLVCLGIAVLVGLQINLSFSFRAGIAIFLWFVIFMVPSIMLMQSKQRYTYWCSNCKKMVPIQPK